jgi:hypothetical protein
MVVVVVVVAVALMAVVVVVAATTPGRKQCNLTWTLDWIGASIPHSH